MLQGRYRVPASQDPKSLLARHETSLFEENRVVLAACALASGCGSILRGFIERAFPYAHLSLCENVMQGVWVPAAAPPPSG